MHIYVHTYVHTYIHAYIHIYIYIHTHINTYCTHMHTDVDMFRLVPRQGDVAEKKPEQARAPVAIVIIIIVVIMMIMISWMYKPTRSDSYPNPLRLTECY